MSAADPSADRVVIRLARMRGFSLMYLTVGCAIKAQNRHHGNKGEENQRAACAEGNQRSGKELEALLRKLCGKKQKTNQNSHKEGKTTKSHNALHKKMNGYSQAFYHWIDFNESESDGACFRSTVACAV
ncbi:MAG: hypothetical protein AB7E29_11685 [Xanthobacter sp.]